MVFNSGSFVDAAKRDFSLLQTLGLVLRQAILVHDPTSPDPFGGFTGVENEGFLEADGPEILASDHPISSGGLPVAGSRNAVRPIAVPILPISRYIEVPLFLPYSRQRWKFPRVVSIEVKESDEFNVETLALHLTAEVEFDKLLLRGVEAKARHHDVVFMLVLLAIGVLLVVHGGCNGHKTMAKPSRSKSEWKPSN